MFDVRSDDLRAFERPTLDYELIIASYYATSAPADQARARLTRVFEKDRACVQFVATSPMFSESWTGDELADVTTTSVVFTS